MMIECKFCGDTIEITDTFPTGFGSIVLSEAWCDKCESFTTVQANKIS